MSNVQRNTTTKLTWTGSQWDLHHAVDFYRKGHWTLKFAAKWLEITPDELVQLMTEPCPTCHGAGTVYKEQL